MKYPPHIWAQLKNKTCEDLISALEKDGAKLDITRGAELVFVYADGRRPTIHRHPKSTYGPKLLKALLTDIAWTEEDMRRLKLIK